MCNCASGTGSFFGIRKGVTFAHRRAAHSSRKSVPPVRYTFARSGNSRAADPSTDRSWPCSPFFVFPLSHLFCRDVCIIIPPNYFVNRFFQILGSRPRSPGLYKNRWPPGEHKNTPPLLHCGVQKGRRRFAVSGLV